MRSAPSSPATIIANDATITAWNAAICRSGLHAVSASPALRIATYAQSPVRLWTLWIFSSS
jgi:hypothetical protein